MNKDQQKRLKFLEAILILKELYINFDFDVRDSNGNFTRRFNMWYQVLSHLDIDTLEFVILDYAKSSIYPPQSPAHILEHYKKIYLDLLPNENEAFDEALTLWRKNAHQFNKTYEQLKLKNEIQAEAFKSVKNKLYVDNGYLTESTENIEKWARKEFLDLYKEYRDKDANRKVKLGGKILEITNDRPKLLE